jgi:hypothetical protein
MPISSLLPEPLRVALRDSTAARRRNAAPLTGRLTWRLRALPAFIIIGGQKCGTSSLFNYLCQHPQILRKAGVKKEIHYFDGGFDPGIDNFAKGEAWYRAHFPLRSELRPNRITGEATPLYLFDPRVPARIASQLPDVKLIALLRNPVERTVSQYFHEKRKGRENLPLEEALRQEEARIARALHAKDFDDPDLIHHSYKLRSLYKEQIERYFEVFGRERVRVLASEEMFADPQGVLSGLFGFLGVDPEYRIPNVEARNVGTRDSKIPPAVTEYLSEYFQPHNRALFELLGREFDW